MGLFYYIFRSAKRRNGYGTAKALLAADYSCVWQALNGSISQTTQFRKRIMDDMNAQMTDGTESQAGGGYCIEIRVDANNKVSVGVEPLKEEAQEGGEENYQPVKSIQEAMAVVKDIYANSGNVKEGMAQSMGDMQEGYSE